MKILFFILLLVFPLLSHSRAIPPHFPPALLYQGQPIDPLCFNTTETTVNLKTCGISPENYQKIYNTDKTSLKQGYVGFEFAPAKSPQGSFFPGGSGYKVIGHFNDAYVLYTTNNSGGSGIFSAIVVVKRTNDHLKINTLRSGDRSNGGIFEVSQVDHKITYHVQITPYDLLTLAKHYPAQLKAYDDLAACAACGIGAAIFERDFSHIQDEKLLRIVFDTASEITNNTQGKYQPCFNQLLASYLKQGKSTFTVNELNTWVEKFNQACIQKSTL